MCVCAGHGTCIEVTGQLVGIGSLLQLCGILGTELRSSSMAVSAFTFWVTSMALSILFLRLSLLGQTSSHRLGLLACEPQRPTHLCLPQCRDFKHTPLCPDYFFHLSSDCRAQVAVFASQTPYQLSCQPSLTAAFVPLQRL